MQEYSKQNTIWANSSKIFQYIYETFTKRIQIKQLYTKETHCFLFSLGSARVFEGSPRGLVMGIIWVFEGSYGICTGGLKGIG